MSTFTILRVSALSLILGSTAIAGAWAETTGTTGSAPGSWAMTAENPGWRQQCLTDTDVRQRLLTDGE